MAQESPGSIPAISNCFFSLLGSKVIEKKASSWDLKLFGESVLKWEKINHSCSAWAVKSLKSELRSGGKIINDQQLPEMGLSFGSANAILSQHFFAANAED